MANTSMQSHFSFLTSTGTFALRAGLVALARALNVIGSKKLMETSRNYFELRRRIDDLVYEFDRMDLGDGQYGYKRRDKDLWIKWHADFGWVAWDGESEIIGGRSWYTLPKDQSDFPPEGVWVSMKKEKSYVYDLVYSKTNNKTL